MTTPDHDGPVPADGPPRVDVLGVGVSCLTLDSAVEEVSGWVDRGEHRYVCVTGVHGVMEAQQDGELHRILNDAWSEHAGRHANGVGRAVARVPRDEPRLRSGPHVSRSVTSRAQKDYTHFLYGGADGVAPELKRRLEEKFPGLKIVGTYTPPFRPLEAAEEAELTRTINALSRTSCGSA